MTVALGASTEARLLPQVLGFLLLAVALSFVVQSGWAVSLNARQLVAQGSGWPLVAVVPLWKEAGYWLGLVAFTAFLALTGAGLLRRAEEPDEHVAEVAVASLCGFMAASVVAVAVRFAMVARPQGEYLLVGVEPVALAILLIRLALVALAAWAYWRLVRPERRFALLALAWFWLVLGGATAGFAMDLLGGVMGDWGRLVPVLVLSCVVIVVFRAGLALLSRQSVPHLARHEPGLPT